MIVGTHGIPEDALDVVTEVEATAVVVFEDEEDDEEDEVEPPAPKTPSIGSKHPARARAAKRSPIRLVLIMAVPSSTIKRTGSPPIKQWPLFSRG